VAGEHLLEIGCGAGQAAQLVLEGLGTRGRLVAIDRSATAIARTVARNTEAVESGRLTALVAELADLDVPGAAFDGAWALNVNVFWTSDPAVELAELKRVLRPKARLLLLWDAGPTGATKLAPVADHLSTAGFRAVASESGAQGTVIRARAPG